MTTILSLAEANCHDLFVNTHNAYMAAREKMQMLVKSVRAHLVSVYGVHAKGLLSKQSTVVVTSKKVAYAYRDMETVILAEKGVGRLVTHLRYLTIEFPNELVKLFESEIIHDPNAYKMFYEDVLNGKQYQKLVSDVTTVVGILRSVDGVRE